MRKVLITAFFIISLALGALSLEIGYWSRPDYMAAAFKIEEYSPSERVMSEKIEGNLDPSPRNFVRELEKILSERVKSEENLPKIQFKTPLGRVETENIALKLSPLRQKVVNSSFRARVAAMKFAHLSGFSYEEAVAYSFPEVAETVFKLKEELYVAPKDAAFSAIENTGKIRVDPATDGRKIVVSNLFCMLFYKLSNFEGEDVLVIEVPLERIKPEVEQGDLAQYMKRRASFSTNFSSSIPSRKANIRKALKFFDGQVILPGQTLSFNQTTGERGENGGYQLAKIIKNGAFVTEYGGGVCQVSTTLYNAALLADLEICEVHPHSLPVSYTLPCFDAMVNSGSSDLVIKNNTDGPIIIATSDRDDVCLVNIYGAKCPFEIKRKSEKTAELPSFETVETSDFSAYGLAAPLEPGEQRVVCVGRPGLKAVGTLEYYRDGVLVKTRRIRENTYAPTKQVVLRG